MFRFVENKHAIEKLRKSFAGLWSLDNMDTVNDAIEKPEFYVLKPQREGGGLVLQFEPLCVVFISFSSLISIILFVTISLGLPLFS